MLLWTLSVFIVSEESNLAERRIFWSRKKEDAAKRVLLLAKILNDHRLESWMSSSYIGAHATDKSLTYPPPLALTRPYTLTPHCQTSRLLIFVALPTCFPLPSLGEVVIQVCQQPLPFRFSIITRCRELSPHTTVRFRSRHGAEFIGCMPRLSRTCRLRLATKVDGSIFYVGLSFFRYTQPWRTCPEN